jgi:hypothetical protein
MGNSSAACVFESVRTSVVAATIGLLLPTCADASGPYNRQLHLSSQEIHERCVDLTVGQQLDYAFKASQSVEFSVRFREGDKVVIPVSRKARSGKGKLTARTDASYCLTLSNPNARGANAYYQYSVREVKPSRASRR